MPSTKGLDNLGGGWWKNLAVDVNGQPRPLGLGLVTIGAGDVRFVDDKTVARSGGAFSLALAAGNLAGPFSSQDAAGGTEPPSPAPDGEQPYQDPDDGDVGSDEPTPVTEPDQDPVTEDASAVAKKRRRFGRGK